MEANNSSWASQANQGSPFENHLLDGEKILWEGQPNPSVRFAKIDMFLAPFSLLWVVVALIVFVVMLMQATGYSHHIQSEPIGLLVALIIGGFIVISGLYFTIGRFWVKAATKRKTHYAITNERALSYCSFNGKKFRSQELGRISSISYEKWLGGNTQLIFEEEKRNQSLFSIPTNTEAFSNTGMELFWPEQPGGSLVFHDIQNVEHVHRIASEAKRRMGKA